MAEDQDVTWVKRLPAVLTALVLSVGITSAVLATLAPEVQAEEAPIVASAPAVAPVAVEAPVTTTTAAPAPTTTTVAPAPTTTTTVPAPAPAPVVEPAPAPAATPASVPAPAAGTPQAKGEQALALIDYPWQRLGFSVAFEGANPGLLGKADCNTNQITVYVRPKQSIRQVAFVTAFELGHAVDCGFMTDQTRAEWAGIRGFAPGWTWFPSCLCTEDDFGSGDISMVFATWLVPDGGYGWRSNLAPPPDAAQLERLLPYLTR